MRTKSFQLGKTEAIRVAVFWETNQVKRRKFFASFFLCFYSFSISSGDSVTSIGNYAFEDCSSLTSVTFKDMNNWYYTSNRNYTGGTAVDVTDKAQNATYLKDTYYNYYWYKEQLKVDCEERIKLSAPFFMNLLRFKALFVGIADI